MKFTCEKALLQAAINTAARAASPKSSLPVLEGLLIAAVQTLTITGYNTETGIRTTVAADIIEQGAVVLPARLLGEIIRKMPDDLVTVEEKKLSVKIRCGMSEFNLMGMDADDFPQLPVVEAKNAFSLPEGSLRDMIARTHFAISDNESRPIHTGSLFEVTEEMLTLVSVDGFRLAMRREPVIESEGVFSFVCPGAALGEVEKICTDSMERSVHVMMGQKHLMFKIGDCLLISRRLEGEFLAWEKAVPRNNPLRIKVEARALLACIDRVSLIISDRLKSPLRCVFGDGQVRLSTKTANGDASDVFSIEEDGGELEIGFNNRYMMDALKAVPGGEVYLELSTGVSPCVIAPAEGEENFLFMVLPVRLRAGEQ